MPTWDFSLGHCDSTAGITLPSLQTGWKCTGVCISLRLLRNKTDSLRSKRSIAWDVTALGNFFLTLEGSLWNHSELSSLWDFFLRTLSCQAFSLILLQLQLSTFIYLPLLKVTWDWVLFDSVSGQWKPINISTVIIVNEFIPNFKMNMDSTIHFDNMSSIILINF